MAAFDDEDPFDDEEEPPLGDRQWHFGDIGGYVYTDTHGRRGRCVAIIGAVGMTAATTRQLAALLLEAADTIEADGAQAAPPKARNRP